MRTHSAKERIAYLIKQLRGKNSNTKLIKDGFWSLAINAGNRAFTLLIGILLVRILGKDHYGVYTYILSLVTIFIIPVEFGLSNLIVRETARGETTNQPGIINGVWRWSFKVTFISSLILIAVGVIAYFLWGKNSFSNNELNTFFWGVTLLLFQALIHISNAALRGTKNIVLGQLPDMIIIPALFIGSFVVLWLLLPISLTSASAMALRTIVTFLALLISLVFLFWKTPQKILSSEPEYKIGKWVSSVIPLGLSSGLNMVKNHTSILILGFFVTAGQIGSYQIAVSTAALAALVLHSMNTLLAPQFASLFVKNEKNKLQQLVTISSRLVFLFNLLITVIFIVWGKYLLIWVFGPETVDAYPALVILLAGQLVNSLVGSVGFLLNMTGYEKDVMKIIGISTVINILLTIILTPYLSIAGAATATSISLIFAQITMFIFVKKHLGISTSAFMKIS